MRSCSRLAALVGGAPLTGGDAKGDTNPAKLVDKTGGGTMVTRPGEFTAAGIRM
jgi:hypothetical protein